MIFCYLWEKCVFQILLYDQNNVFELFKIKPICGFSLVSSINYFNNFVLSYGEFYFFSANYLEQMNFNNWYFYGERQFLNIYIIMYFPKLLTNSKSLESFGSQLVSSQNQPYFTRYSSFPFQNNFQ